MIRNKEELAKMRKAGKVVAEMHSLPIHDASTPSAWLREILNAVPDSVRAGGSIAVKGQA